MYSYPSIYAIGHKELSELFDDPVLVEEKVDGSQFSFTKTKEGLQCRSKNQMIDVDNPPKMFQQAVDVVKDIQNQLMPNWVYRSEYLNSPKHNTLRYNRVPTNYIVIFDICRDRMEDYLLYGDKYDEANRIGLECVPLIYQGKINNVDTIKELLDRESFLGGPKIEGVVVKNYRKLSREKKILIGKFVSEAFKEKHQVDWKNRNPAQSDILINLIETYRTEPRWRKAIQHLRDNGELQNAPQDIPNLMKEVGTDVFQEEAEEIKEKLFKYFWPRIQRGITVGLPEWYKNYLLESAFEDVRV